MKVSQLNIVLILIFTLAVLNKSYSQQDQLIVIDTKVGPVIDRNERDLFNLYESVNNFLEARIYRSALGEYFAEIKTSDSNNKTEIIIYYDLFYLLQLAEYIKHFDEIYAGSYKMGKDPAYLFVNKAAEYKIINLPNSFLKMEDSYVKIRMFRKKSSAGQLVSVRNSSIIIWDKEFIYNQNSNSFQAHLFEIGFNEIEKISLAEGSDAFKGMIIGGLSGAGTGILIGLLSTHNDNEQNSYSKSIVTNGLIFSVIGAIIGAGIGTVNQYEKNFNPNSPIDILQLRDIAFYKIEEPYFLKAAQ